MAGLVRPRRRPVAVAGPLTGFPLADDQPRPLDPAAAELLADRPVLVSGGTGRMMHPRFYEVAVEACRLADRPALLVVRHPDLVPRPLPDQVRWVPALPFHEVMPQVGVVLHHGGIGTLARALTAGTPQVILAHGVDRPDNAERLAALGLAQWLPAGSWDPKTVATLLTEAESRDAVGGVRGAAVAAADARDGLGDEPTGSLAGAEPGDVLDGGLGDAASLAEAALGGGRAGLGAMASFAEEESGGVRGGRRDGLGRALTEAESGGGRDGLGSAMASFIDAESGGVRGGRRDGLGRALAALLAEAESGGGLDGATALGGARDGLGGAVALLEGLLEPRAVSDEVLPGRLARLPAERRAALRRLLEARR